MDYKHAESLVKPSLVDMTSSPDGIYVRRNIKETETENGTKYTYEECFMSQNEYETYKTSRYEDVVSDSLNSLQLRRENEIIDDYTLKLVEEGSL